MSEARKDPAASRRAFVGKVAKGAGLFALGGLLGRLAPRTRAETTVWQIDPEKCIQCGNCATACVLTPSASKCVHDFKIPCGYCRKCSGFSGTEYIEIDEAAENQRCPVGAIGRGFIEEPYYEYVIDQDLCIGCARCVEGCRLYGNGSLYMQINRRLCVNCNECSIARVCEGDAISRIPASQQYIPKKRG